MTDDDICGHPTDHDGEPCRNPATEGNTCWIDTHGGSASVGRNTKLDKAMQENIATMLEDGHSIQAACRCNGIAPSTFYDWLDRGEKQDEGIFSEFSERIASARGAGERKLVDELLDMARSKGDTRTMLSVLKSRYPESWGDADPAENGGTVNIHLSPEDDA